MNEPSFELNAPGYYTPQYVVENDYLNKLLTTDMYGRWYSVQFEGNAETYNWQAKNQPETGKAYWGQLELAKSGKSTKFKKLKEEDAPSSQPANSSSNFETVDKQDSINRAVALNNAALFWSNQPDAHTSTDMITQLADLFLSWLKNETTSTTAIEADSVQQTGYEKARETARSIGDSKLRSSADKATGPHTGDYPTNQTDQDFLDLVARGSNDG